MPDDPPPEHAQNDEQCANQQASREARTGPHSSVIAVPGSPPWFSCQRCGAYRSTHAGLRDLPCEPDRYEDVAPAQRVSVGDVVQARTDQVFETESGNLGVLAHTVGTGVRIGLETGHRDIARGDEISVRITEVDGVAKGVVEHIISRDDRVRPPTFVSRENGGEGR